MKINSNLRAGVFMFVALAAFVCTILLLGKERRIFASTETYFTSMSNVGGLSVGAPVRFGGITVGRVAEIGFAPEQSDLSVHVGFTVEKKFIDRVRSDSVVSIETQGLLGDKFLSISSGMGQTSEMPIAPGAYLASKEPTDISQILQKASQVVENTVEISDSVKEVLEQVKTDTVHDFSATMKGLAEIGRAVREEQGVLHRLIYPSKEGENILDSMTHAAESIEKVLHDLEHGDGLLHTLVYDPKGKEFVTSLTGAADNIAETSMRFSEIAGQIKDGNGIMHQLVYDDKINVGEKISQTAEKLEGAATSLKKASDALANGEGTIGALLVDGQLYDNLIEITNGAKRSFLLRQAIKSSLQ